MGFCDISGRTFVQLIYTSGQEVPFDQLLFYKETRRLQDYAVLPPHAFVAKELIPGKRVAYGINKAVSDAKSRLIDKARAPHLFDNPDIEYYIYKQAVPPLQRLWTLLEQDVKEWASEFLNARKQQMGALGNFMQVRRLCDLCGKKQIMKPNFLLAELLRAQNTPIRNICDSCQTKNPRCTAGVLLNLLMSCFKVALKNVIEGAFVIQLSGVLFFNSELMLRYRHAKNPRHARIGGAHQGRRRKPLHRLRRKAATPPHNRIVQEFHM